MAEPRRYAGARNSKHLAEFRQYLNSMMDVEEHAFTVNLEVVINAVPGIFRQRWVVPSGYNFFFEQIGGYRNFPATAAGPVADLTLQEVFLITVQVHVNPPDVDLFSQPATLAQIIGNVVGASQAPISLAEFGIPPWRMTEGTIVDSTFTVNAAAAQGFAAVCLHGILIPNAVIEEAGGTF